MRLAVLLVLAAVGTAQAQDLPGGGLSIEVSDVNDHRDEVILMDNDGNIVELGAGYNVSFKVGRGFVTVHVQDGDCDASRRFTFAQLRSKMALRRAERLVDDGNPVDAAAMARKAIAEDRLAPDPAFLLAALQLQLGPPRDALATLRPWIKREPKETYAKIMATDELAPLRTAAEIVALRTRQGSLASRKVTSFCF